MGKKDVEALEITIDELPTYLHTNHAVYMEVADGLYYLTDVNDRYWRAQATTSTRAPSSPRSPSSSSCPSATAGR